MSEDISQKLLTKLTEIETSQKREFADLNNKFTGLDNKVTNLDNKFTDLDSKVTNLDNKFTDLDSKVTNLDNKYTVLNKKVDVLTDQQQQIKQAVMETNESVKRLESIQNSQHRIIELLSTRSIEQEAEIKRIK